MARRVLSRNCTTLKDFSDNARIENAVRERLEKGRERVERERGERERDRKTERKTDRQSDKQTETVEYAVPIFISRGLRVYFTGFFSEVYKYIRTMGFAWVS